MHKSESREREGKFSRCSFGRDKTLSQKLTVMGILTTGNKERQPKIGIVKRELDTLMREKLRKRNNIPWNEENLKICWKYIFMCLKHMKCYILWHFMEAKSKPNKYHPLERKLRARQTLHFLAKLLAGNRAKANKDTDWLRCYNVEVGREEFGSLIFLSFIMEKKNRRVKKGRGIK